MHSEALSATDGDGDDACSVSSQMMHSSGNSDSDSRHQMDAHKVLLAAQKDVQIERKYRSGQGYLAGARNKYEPALRKPAAGY